ncbi:MAG: dodecin [Thermodesulfobacteriota bacterium]
MAKTFKQIELVGISSDSYEDAIQHAVVKAAKTLRNLAWYEVLEQRGKIDNGKVSEYQVVLKVSFKLD